jgi:uncharacterized protein (TIGR03435 family)
MKRPVFCVFVLLASVGYGQKPERLTFEVVSVKPTPADERDGGIKALPGGQTYQARNVPVKLMFSLMYKIPMQRISGGPAWLDTDRWNVDAKAAHAYSLDDLHIMYQNLLADEFKIQFHKEVKEGSVYALTIDKGGLKMKPNSTEQDFKIPISGDRNGFMGTRVPMEYFCWWLGQAALGRDGRPVLDKTGLKGFYDFSLSFAPELPPGVDASQLPPGLMDRPPIFTALKEQLGLKLEAQKGPVDYVVIDKAEKPVEN